MFFDQFTHEPIPADVLESDLIDAAQVGDSESMEVLISAYLPGLGAHVKDFAAVLPSHEDAEQEILATFLAHVHSIDLERTTDCRGFVGALQDRLHDLGAQRTGIGGIHRRTLLAYARLMKAADGDVQRAADLAGGRVSPRQILQIHDALASAYSLLPTDTVILGDDSDADILEEEYRTIRECVDRLPSDERAVIRYAYGFETPRPLTDGEIVEEWSRAMFSPEEFERGDRVASRVTVLRRRNAALATLREDYLASLNGLPVSSSPDA